MINTKISKAAVQTSNEDKLFKLLESMDWKLWEIYLMLKDYKEAEFASKKSESAAKKTAPATDKPKKKFVDKIESE